MDLPSFASDAKKALYSELLNVCREQIDQSPIFWNWVSAGFLTGPTLKKVFFLKDLLDRTSKSKSPIFEFGSGLGTKAFTLLNIQSLSSLAIRPIFAFDSLLGYSESGMLSLAKSKDKVIQNYESVNFILRELYETDYDLINFNIGELPQSLLKLDIRQKASLCFIDVQGGELTMSMLIWAMENIEVGGIIVIEGVDSPFFPEVSKSLIEFDIPDNFRVLRLGWEFTLIIERIDLVV
jgi:hypothetical protein